MSDYQEQVKQYKKSYEDKEDDLLIMMALAELLGHIDTGIPSITALRNVLIERADP